MENKMPISTDTLIVNDNPVSIADDSTISDDNSIINKEFQHIALALEVFAKALHQDFPRCTQDSIKPLFEVLDYRKAKSVAQGAFLLSDVTVDPVCLLSCLSGTATHYRNIRAVMKRNMTSSDYDTCFHPVDFYKRALFRFDGEYIRAQYLYSFGLGIVLQLGGSKVGPLNAALAMEKIGRTFVYRDSDDWRLISLFAGNTAADGSDWSACPTIDEAKRAYYKRQALKRKRRERKDGRESAKKGHVEIEYTVGSETPDIEDVISQTSLKENEVEDVEHTLFESDNDVDDNTPQLLSAAEETLTSRLHGCAATSVP